MNLFNHYWYFESALTPRFCDDVIAYANKQKEVMALTGGYQSKNLSKKEIKNVQKKRKLTDGSEYRGGELEFDFRNYDPHMRDESQHLKKAKEILSKGSIIVFPSHVWHRVKPVTSGTRYSLVVWHLGKPFK